MKATPVTEILQELFAVQGMDEQLDLLQHLSLRRITAQDLVESASLLRGETPRIKALRDSPFDTVDVCGTGGDGRQTLNISTAVAFVVAARGIPVAKHGNRAASSMAGAADVLEELGVRIDLAPDQSARQLAESGFTFLFAPGYYPALASIANARRRLGRRTLLNCIGPLLNPAWPRHQVIGVYDRDLMPVMADAFMMLGGEHCAIVHAGGMDELDPSSVCEIYSLYAEMAHREVVDCHALGFGHYRRDALQGGNAAFNAAALERLLAGEKSAYREAVILNSALAMRTAAAAEDLHEGCADAARLIDDGIALDVFRKVKEFNPG